MTYARARLRVGITGVGTVVLLSVSALILDWPFALDAFGNDLLALGTVLLLHVAVLAPFDFFGGKVLPAKFGRSSESWGRFLGRWLRGVVLQCAIVGSIALALLSGGRAAGLAGATVCFALAMVVLIAFQGPLALSLASLNPVRRSGRTVTVKSSDRGFTGGVVGLPGRERLLVPAHWAELLEEPGLSIQLSRWKSSIVSRGRALGLAVAFCWNLGGFLLSSLMPGADVTTVPGLTTLALAFTLWSFLGLLLLPTLSRSAVFAADRAVAEARAPRELIEVTVKRLDREQDDEPQRSPGVETIFHPIPSVSRRLSALASGDAPRVGPWHAARMALFLSWAGFGFLSRAVHCNSGRPELWALLPCD